MTNLIIGHTDHQSVKVWVRGDRTYSRVAVRVLPTGTEKPNFPNRPNYEKLNSGTDYTHVVEVPGLHGDEEYDVIAVFAGGFLRRKKQTVNGSFRTFPEPGAGEEEYSFVLGSCNISIVKVNNLLGLALGMAGQLSTHRALKRKPRGKFRRLRVFWRLILRFKYFVLMIFVNLATGFKQSGSPLLTSPFLNICALFDTSTIRFDVGKHEPPLGSTIHGESSGAKGKLLRTTKTGGFWERPYGPHATGSLMLTKPNNKFSAGDMLTIQDESEPNITKTLGECTQVAGSTIYFKDGEYEPQLYSEIHGGNPEAIGTLIDTTVNVGYWKTTGKPGATGSLVLTDRTGEFSAGEKLRFNYKSESRANMTIGNVVSATQLRPSFMIHAGDQIYFDFPFARERPTHKQYRLSYQETWFEDEWAQLLFRQCPHYMALDDHDIVNDYATDFEPRQAPTSFKPPGIVTRIRNLLRKPEGIRTPESYSGPALDVYRQYVKPRHPDDYKVIYGKRFKDIYYFDFQHGDTHFFVMDTRTERKMGRKTEGKEPEQPQMIGSIQMSHFQNWLETYDDKLKFVVSSVPFVAQIRATSDEGREHEKTKTGELSPDKWCGEPYRKQREEIINFIRQRRISNLVFLTGDMHCCYHATMRIGDRHERFTIHELGAGPVYQLRTGHRSHFASQFERTTQSGSDRFRYRTQLEQIHGGSSAVMQIKVKTEEKFHEIDWDVVRTIGGSETGASPMSGCIVLDRQEDKNATV